MSIQKIEDGNDIILRINADSLVKDEAMMLKKTALSIIESGTNRLKLDLTQTKYIDSSGIGKLLFLNKRLEQDGGYLEIISINKNLYEFLDSLAITKVIKVVNPG